MTISTENTISSANLLCALLTYLIESKIYPGCSNDEFNVFHVQRQNSQYLLYYNNI